MIIFSQLHILLEKYGKEDLVSRAQARRVIARFDNFEEIVLDFKEIDIIGPSFADEIFRVFQNRHPEIKIVAVGMNKDVERMINRAIAAQKQAQDKN